jgi:hypothetical protein
MGKALTSEEMDFEIEVGKLAIERIVARKRLLKASESAYYWIEQALEDFDLEDNGTLEELKEALEGVGVKLC